MDSSPDTDAEVVAAAAVVITPEGKRAIRKLTRYSLFWLVLFPVVGYELWAVITGKDGGPLTHVVGWAYGEQYSPRWWLLAGIVDGILLWAAPHFRWPEIVDWHWLLCFVAVGVLLGLVGIVLTSR